MKKLLCLMLAVLMITGLLAGCGGNKEEKTSTEPTAANNDATKAPTAAPTYEASDVNADIDEVELPLTENGEQFTYWLYNGQSFEDFATYDDNLFYQWMEEQTGVDLVFVHPAVGSQNEAFQTMILSGDYCDFLQGVKSYYTGGVDKAIKDEVLIPLNDAVDQWMPHYRRYVYETEETFIQAITDTGYLWGVHHIVDRPQGAFVGPVVRQDWLDECGLDYSILETIDGLEQVLTAFKTKTYENRGPLWLGQNSATIGYSFNGSFNYSGVGNANMINKDGKATYGARVGMKEYAAKMADWYAKGLINTEYVAAASFLVPDAQAVNSCIGVYELVYTYPNMYAASAKVSELQPDDDFFLRGFTTPKLNASDDYWNDIHLRQQNTKIRAGNSMGITTHCTNLELACRFWDYAWTDEAIVHANWGTIGEYGDENTISYIDPDDSNHDGHVECYQPWTMEKWGNVSSVQVKNAVHNGPTYSIWSREWCTLDENAIQMQYIWDTAGCDWVWPDGVTLTSDEGAEASSIIANANTAATEWLVAVITGEKSAETYDTELMPKLEGMNIARAEELYQTALDRYFARAEYYNS